MHMHAQPVWTTSRSTTWARSCYEAAAAIITAYNYSAFKASAYAVWPFILSEVYWFINHRFYDGLECCDHSGPIKLQYTLLFESKTHLISADKQALRMLFKITIRFYDI